MSYRPEFFSWRKAILKSDLPPTTRHVLLTLACHMNDAGESCYPSVKLLCKETGLSNRTVITHLQNAKDLGWIIVGIHGFAGQRWAAHEYFPGWPHNLRESADSLEKAVNEVHQLKKKAVKKIHRVPTEGGEPVAEGGEPVAEGGEPVAEGGEPVAKKAVNEVHTSTSLLSTPLSASGSTSENLLAPDESGAPAKKSEAVTNEAWAAYNTAYFNRYGTEMIETGKTRGQMMNFIKRVGRKDAPHIAAFYVAHDNKYYIQNQHTLGPLVRDAESLRTQWITGRTMTSRRASEIDDTATNVNAVNEAIAMLRRREKNAAL